MAHSNNINCISSFTDSAGEKTDEKQRPSCEDAAVQVWTMYFKNCGKHDSFFDILAKPILLWLVIIIIFSDRIFSVDIEFHYIMLAPFASTALTV